MGENLSTREDVIRKELEEFKVLGKRKTKARNKLNRYHNEIGKPEKRLKVDFLDVGNVKASVF